MKWVDVEWSLEEDTAPATEPVTTAEAKAHAVIEHTDDDDAGTGLILALIKTARAYVESYTNRQLVSATYVLYADGFPSDRILIPRPPVSAVTHVKYYDVAGSQRTWSADDYETDLNSKPGRIFPDDAATWPTTQSSKVGAVEVEYVCGYGNAAAVPDIFKTAIKMLVDGWYRFRDAQSGKNIQAIEVGVNRLLQSEVIETW